MLLDDIRSYLISQGAVPSGFSIYIGYIPDDTDQVICLFETGGFAPETLLRENENVTFQTRVRSSRLSYQLCRTVWKGIYDTLQDSIPAAGYYLVQAMHAGPMVFTDDRGRENMTSNWKVKKARS